MKLTSQQLQQIIKEELQAVLGEQEESNEEKIIGLCRNPDTTETGNISGESLGLGNCLDIAYKKFEDRAGQQPGDIEKEVIRLVKEKLGFDGVFDLLKQQVLDINKGLHAGKVKYLTQQNLEEIFQMFNPPKHKTIDYGEGSFSFSAVDQSRERAQMMLMFTNFAPNLKINLLSPIDQQGFDEDDFEALEMNPPTNIEFYGGYR